MLEITRRLITYACPLTGKATSHYVLIGLSGTVRSLLSHANLYLRAATSQSEDTSNRYSNVISMFYRHLSVLDKYKGVELSQYHALVDNEDLKSWQVQRAIDRQAQQSLRPSTQTIEDDARLVYGFMYWLDCEGYSSCLNFKLKTWQPNFKNEELLSYIKRQARVALDAKSIKALDRDWRQGKSYSLITNQEISDFLGGFHDLVYVVMFRLALDTAMRPMDLCNFPYAGNGANSHIQPWENISFDESTVAYRIFWSKGRKHRDIRIHEKALKMLFDDYTNTLYPVRAELYAKRYGRPCPPSILFLNAAGKPVTSKMVATRSTAAKTKAIRDGSKMRADVCFYDSRHWWPTMYLIKHFGPKLLGDISEVREMAAIQVLKDQMGHSYLHTTFDHYVDVARVLLLAHEGYVNELHSNMDQTVGEFLKEPVFS
ncbi:site-specific integrase [Pseudomonas kurunegalensis]|uniref:Site-specific integrase n=1 Tax=Pseudomonas kurunegalensis TaxID=485880 RepID=A0ACC5UP48_9PSED|nr:site-specific integrase [Pseudomonas kurunegalensis]MBV4516187.1 site-specific integrase [Pseudomonas kurunegalensis]